MKKLQRFLSAVLCIVMIMAMAVPAAASAAPATSKLSVSDILKDFGSSNYTVAEFGEGGKFSLDEFQAGTGVIAKHTVYEGVKATQLVAQNISWASYAKTHIAFGNNVNAFKEYGYMVVKYASVSDKAYSLSVGGWGSMESGATFTVPAGKTGWTTSEVLAISPACAAVATTKRHITSSYAAETYIGDIVFFKNKADAEEYAKWAPIYLDPNGDAALRRIQKREENWETIKLIMMLIGSAVAERMEFKPDPKIKPFEGIVEGTYTVAALGDGGKFSLDEFQVGTGVIAKHTVYEGVKATQLVAQNISWASYAKTHIAFVNNVTAFKEYDYMVVKYASVSDYPYEINVGGWGSTANGATFAVPAGNTGWTLSEVLTVTDECEAVATSKRHIVSTDAAAETYIADIAFFKNKDDAKLYIKQWNAYYEGVYDMPVDPIAEAEDGYFRITFDEDSSYRIGRVATDNNSYTEVLQPDAGVAASKNGKYTHGLNSQFEGNMGQANNTNYGSDFATYTTYNGVDCIASVVSSNWFAGNKPAICFDINNANVHHNGAYRNYAVLTYASETDKQQEFGVAWGNAGGIKGAQPNPDGWMSVAFELTGAWSNAGGNRVKQGIKSTINEPFYVRELVFFETMEDAEAYAAKAPAYFNGEEYDEDAVVPSHPVNTYANNVWTRVAFTEGSVAAAGSAVGTFRFHDNGCTNNNAFVKHDVSYISAKAVPAGWASNSVGKRAFQIVFNNLGTAFAVTDDAYIVMVLRSESASDQVIGINPVAFGNFNVGTIPANTEGWTAIVSTNVKDALNGTTTLYEKLTTRETVIYTTAADVGTLDVIEIAFLKTEDAAKAYAAAAPKYYASIEALDIFNQIEANGEGDVFVQHFSEEGVDCDVENGEDGHSTTPVSYVTYNGLPAVKLEYKGQHWPYGNGMSSYRLDYTGGAFGGKLTADHKYAVVTYATETNSHAPMVMYHWAQAVAEDPVDTVVVPDISVSNGKWVTSGVVEVSANWFKRASTNKVCLVSKDTATDAPLYIHSIAYFTDKADAEYYVENAPAYYNGENIVDPSYWLSVLGEGEVYTTTFEELDVTYAASINYTSYAEATFGKRKVPCVSFEFGEPHDIYSPASSKCHFSFTDKPGYGDVLTEGAPYEYAVVTYATKAETPAYLKAETWGTPNHVTFASDITVSNGKWVTSDIVEIGMPMAKNAAGKMIFYSDLTEEGTPIYIREIKFFESLADAQYYQANAPEYFNKNFGK